MREHQPPVQDAELWGALRSANAKHEWHQVCAIIEASNVPVEDIAHYLWTSTQPLPHSDKPLMYRDVRRFVERREGEEYPRLRKLVQRWYAPLYEARQAYIEYGKASGELVPFIMADQQSIPVGWIVRELDIRTLPVSYCFEKMTHAGLLGDEHSGVGITPDGVGVYLSQLDMDWVRRVHHNPDEETLQRCRYIEVHVGDVLPVGEAVDSLLCAMRLTHEDFQWFESFVSSDVISQAFFTPHRLMRQDDNGHEFEVGVFESRSAAVLEERRLARRMHKQHYWVEPIK